MFFEAIGLTKRFGGLTAVADVSFAIARGEIVGVFGPNGSGKTTLLNLIMGIFRPTGGRLIWKDRPLAGRPPHEVAQLGIIKTFQNPQLFEELSVAQHVSIAAHLRLRRALGMRRVVTLVKPARYDETLRGEVERVLRLCRLAAVLRDLRRHGTTLCVIDHKVGFLRDLADRAVAMHHGRKIAEGTPAAVI